VQTIYCCIYFATYEWLLLPACSSSAGSKHWRLPVSQLILRIAENRDISVDLPNDTNLSTLENSQHHIYRAAAYQQSAIMIDCDAFQRVPSHIFTEAS
jgi:hypothetical protein